MSSLQDEPVVMVTAAVAVIESSLGALVAFGFNLSAEQVAGVLGVANAVGALIAIAITRQMVFAPSTVKDEYVSKYTTPEEIYGTKPEEIYGEAQPAVWSNFHAARQPTRFRFEDGDVVGEFNIRSKDAKDVKPAKFKMGDRTSEKSEVV